MPQRRRSRFTVHIVGREPRVVLSYTSAGAGEHYERMGYTVLKVVKGDHRKPVALPARRFVIDQPALADAIDLLGLKVPVKIRYNSRQGATAGNYRFRYGAHDIMLKSYATAAEASQTLWHELQHAVQAERAGTAQDWTKVVNDQRRYPYSRRPIEVEARALATQMSDCSLTKAA